ncbi:MAG: hypothetical protein GY913_22360 [Proteobacteria bacterium]|nr:hypothetical protein [Pseudomonadota bacterium]MCP4919653.1 hypothetical protein [Pseudomonadota bacterium]
MIPALAWWGWILLVVGGLGAAFLALVWWELFGPVTMVPGPPEQKQLPPVPLRPARHEGFVRLDEVPEYGPWPASVSKAGTSTTETCTEHEAGVFAHGWPDGRLRKLVVVKGHRVQGAVSQRRDGTLAELMISGHQDGRLTSWAGEQRTERYIEHFSTWDDDSLPQPTSEAFDDTVYRWMCLLVTPLHMRH